MTQSVRYRTLQVEILFSLTITLSKIESFKQSPDPSKIYMQPKPGGPTLG
jgi:hypothetical protein